MIILKHMVPRGEGWNVFGFWQRQPGVGDMQWVVYFGRFG